DSCNRTGSGPTGTQGRGSSSGPGPHRDCRDIGQGAGARGVRPTSPAGGCVRAEDGPDGPGRGARSADVQGQAGAEACRGATALCAAPAGDGRPAAAFRLVSDLVEPASPGEHSPGITLASEQKTADAQGGPADC